MKTKKTDEANKFVLKQALEATCRSRLKEIKDTSNSTSYILRRYFPLMAYEGD